MNRRNIIKNNLNFARFPLQNEVLIDIQTSSDGEYVVLLYKKKYAPKQEGIINIYHVESNKKIYQSEVLSASSRQTMKIAISFNGKYVSAFIGDQIVVIDTQSKVQCFSTTYAKSDIPNSLLVTDRGRILIGFPDRVVTINPFAEDKKRYRLYKAQMEIYGLVHSPDDASFAIIERQKIKTSFGTEDKGLISVYYPKDRQFLIQPNEEQIYTTYKNTDWFGEEEEKI